MDRSGLDFLTDRLRDRAGGVVVVSHDRALLADLADSVLSLDPTPDGRPRLYGGGYTGYRDRSAAERMQWEQEYAREQVEHAKLQDDLQAARLGWSLGGVRQKALVNTSEPLVLHRRCIMCSGDRMHWQLMRSPFPNRR